MTIQMDDAYKFVFRGLLTEQALDRAGRRTRDHGVAVDAEFVRALSLDLLDDNLVATARSMATVYTAIAAFENSIRSLISTVLIEQVDEEWWDKCVSEKIRKRAEAKLKEEEKFRWHSQRGQDPIYYTLMGDLVSIVRQNWDHLEPYFPSIEWVTSVLDTIERSRNVIMHSGVLQRSDVERVGILIRDWVKQVGA